MSENDWDPTGTFRAIHNAEKREVVALCERIGYGNVMHLASDAWAEKDPVGSFVVGTCRGLLPCKVCGGNRRAPEPTGEDVETLAKALNEECGRVLTTTQRAAIMPLVRDLCSTIRSRTQGEP